MVNSGEFQGRVAMVTGGAAGIGEAICRRLAAGGATVVVTDINGDAAAKLARDLGGQCYGEHLDTSDASQVEQVIASIVKRTGRLDMAVNNAGIGEPFAPVADKAVEDWRKVMSVNLDGVFYCLKHEISAMLGRGGAIVNIASVLGLNAFPGAAAYTAAKHGVIGLTKGAAVEYAASGVRINAIAPAFITTPLLMKTLDEDALTTVIARHPIGRLGTPEEVAELTAFLLSDRAAFITGSCHLIDGGYDAQ